MEDAVYELASRNPWAALVVAAAVGVGGVVNHYCHKEAPAKIVVNAGQIYDGEAFFRNDHVMFPISFAQKAGVETFYDPNTGIAVLRQGNDNIAVKAENATLVAFPSDGDRWLTEGEGALGAPFDPLLMPMETAPGMEGDQLCLPLRVIAAALHADPSSVGWDTTTRTASFTTPAPLSGEADAPQTFTAPDFLKAAFDAGTSPPAPVAQASTEGASDSSP